MGILGGKGEISGRRGLPHQRGRTGRESNASILLPSPGHRRQRGKGRNETVRNNRRVHTAKDPSIALGHGRHYRVKTKVERGERSEPEQGGRRAGLGGGIPFHYRCRAKKKKQRRGGKAACTIVTGSGVQEFQGRAQPARSIRQMTRTTYFRGGGGREEKGKRQS